MQAVTQQGKHALRVLLLEDDENDARLVLRQLERYGYAAEARIEETEDGLRRALGAWQPDIVISDCNMPRLDTLRGLETLRELAVNVPRILVSGHIGEEEAVELIHRGANDFVSKDNLARLGPAVDRALENNRLRLERETARRKLEDSEARYRYLFERDTNGIILMLDDRFVDCNEAAAQIYGMTREQLIGLSPLDISPEYQPDGQKSEDRARAFLKEALAGREQTFEWQHLIPSGAEVINEVRLGRLDGVAGANLHAIVRDLTEERRAEAARRRSEANYRALFEGVPDGVFLLRRDGSYVEANERVESLFGWSRAWLVGRTFADVSPPTQPDGTPSLEKGLAHIERVMQGEPQAFEWQIVKGDGSPAVLQVVLGRLDGGGSADVYAIGRDVTAERERERREREQFAILSGISENTSDVIFVKDREGRYLHMNSSGAAFLGISRDRLLGLRDEDVFPPEVAEKIADDDRRVFASGRTQLIEERMAPAGDERIMQTTKGVCRDDSGRAFGIFGISRDVTRQRRTEIERLKLSRALEQAGDAVMITDLQRRIEYVNSAFERITGYAVSEVVGKNPRVLRSGMTEPATQERLNAALQAGERFEGVFINRRRNGQHYYADMTVAPIRDDQGEITHYVATHSDITDKLRTEKELERLAYFDPVTGLSNRNFLSRQLEQLLELRGHEWVRLAVLHIDLDGFGKVNLSLGQENGDAVLQIVGERLSALLQAPATVGRAAGDSFVALVPQIQAEVELEHTIEQIQSIIAAPIKLQDREVLVTASVGAAFAPDDGTTAEQLLQGAEAALEQARGAGSERVAYYAQRMTEESRQWVKTHTDLRHALEREEFLLEYQPKVNLEDGSIAGAEALLRWQHRERGRIGPDQFIPLLEKTGLIVPVGEWVILEACRQVAAWRDALSDAIGRPIRPVSVNLSFDQFRQRDLAGMVRRLLEETGVHPGLLELELTETSLAQNSDSAVKTLDALRELGVTVSLDDFGKGYSSLTYLRKFPIDVVKIDREFTSGIGVSSGNEAIMRAVLRLASDLGIKAVAEGVETEEQVQFLVAEGCRIAQGFFFSRPLPPREFSVHMVDGTTLYRPA